MGRFKDPTLLSQWEGYFRIIAQPSFLNKISMNITGVLFGVQSRRGVLPSLIVSLGMSYACSSRQGKRKRGGAAFLVIKRKYFVQPCITRPVISKSFLSTIHRLLVFPLITYLPSLPNFYSTPFRTYSRFFLPIRTLVIYSPFLPNSHSTPFFTYLPIVIDPTLIIFSRFLPNSLNSSSVTYLPISTQLPLNHLLPILVKLP